jgi:hypothetical protein
MPESRYEAWTLEMLRDYRNWVLQPPAVILRAVIWHGGWTTVFPIGVTTWAHRVRNYFNLTPTKLRLLLTRTTIGSLRTLGGLARSQLAGGIGIGKPLELSGDVYEDEFGRCWYEMHAGRTVYHYKGDPGLKGVKTTAQGQKYVPLVKLFSPDNSGGSVEMCLHNWQVHRSANDALNPLALGTSGTSSIGNGEWVSIKGKVIANSEYRGSYNYSESAIVGFSAHKLRDIVPHEVVSNSYVNPLLYSSMSSRRFPMEDQAGRLLHEQN